MRQELKKLPKEMQDAYKKVPNRPDKNTPACIMSFMDESQDAFIQAYTNPFLINQIVDFADETLLEKDLDETSGDDAVYQKFAIEVTKKIVGLVDLDTNKSKDLEFYDNNDKIKRLKVKDFTNIGDLSDKSWREKADLFAEFYGVQTDMQYLSMTEWELRLFVDKVASRQKTKAEKN